MDERLKEQTNNLRGNKETLGCGAVMQPGPGIQQEGPQLCPAAPQGYPRKPTDSGLIYASINGGRGGGSQTIKHTQCSLMVLN